MPGVCERGELVWKVSRGGLVALAGGLAVEGLVWAFVAVEMPEVIEGTLLGVWGVFRGSAGGGLEIFCMRSWAVSWGEAGRMRRCWLPGRIRQTLSFERRWILQEAERDAVVGADGVWEAEAKEGAFEDREGALGFDVRQSPAGAKETGVLIGEGEGEAPLAIAGVELALEVGGPQVVGFVGVGRDGAGMLVGASPASFVDQALSL